MSAAYKDPFEEHEEAAVHGSWRKLVAQLARQKAMVWSGVALVLVSTLALLVEPRLVGYAIDSGILPKDHALLRALTLAFLAVSIIRFVATVAQSYVFAVLGQRVMQDLRLELYSHIQRLPTQVFDRTPAGKLLTRVTNDVASLAELFSAGLVAMLGNVLTIAGIIVSLFILDLRLALIACAVFPVLLGASIYFSRQLQIGYRQARSKLSALNAFLAENILGMRVVQLFNREKIHFERFERINQAYNDAQVHTVRTYAYFQPAITWATGISVALVLWFGGLRVHDETLPLGVLVAYFSYVLALFQPVREIADKWNIFLSGMASVERIYSILAWPVELGSSEDAREAEPVSIRGRIEFRNVWFAYDKEHWVLKDFSLTIEPGERVGVVGHTGAGKTTLISLILRFYEPQKGRILLDGKDLREYSRRDLRAAIGLVQQDVFLFSGTVAENVGLWKRGRESAVMNLPLIRSRGDVKLEERASNLSSGEKQVIAFGRALAAKPAIWILDEATANVDSETERLLTESLDEASRGRTTLLIAHRLATVRAANKILVLHHGSLVEQGNHDALVALNGLYARLYRYQAALEATASPDDGPQPSSSPQKLSSQSV